MENDDRKMYGVWIPGKGWLKGASVFADYDYSKAKQVAYLIGQKSKVRYIDQSIIDIENLYLEQKGKSLWHTFKNYFKRNGSK